MPGLGALISAAQEKHSLESLKELSSDPSEQHADEAALAARITELAEDFLADSGVGLPENVFDRIALGFEALQDAYLEETKLHAQKASHLQETSAKVAMFIARIQFLGR